MMVIEVQLLLAVGRVLRRLQVQDHADHGFFPVLLEEEADERLGKPEQLPARDRVLQPSRAWVDCPGPVPGPALVPPHNIAGVRARMDPVPALGEHTADVLAELGYTNASGGVA